MKRILLLCLAALIPVLAGAQDPAPDYSAFVLTPKAPDTPRINGPKVYGARPGADFLFRIPATGVRPMRFEAKGLPRGLKLDSETGIIRGKARKRGTYRVALKAINALGTSERTLRIVIGDEVALTPPMGWSSWNCWGSGVTQERVKAVADAMLKYDLVNYGWSYVNIDDGWQGVRGGKYNAIQPNSGFPDIKGLADYLHRNGLKFGIYSSPWAGTYAGYIGSSCDDPEGKYWWVEEGAVTPFMQLDKTRYDRDTLWYFGEHSFARQDALQWAEWGVDYLKYDWNAVDAWWLKDMREALLATGRDIVFSISNFTSAALGTVLMEDAECWRTGGDLKDTWGKIRGAIPRQERWAGFTRPGHWPDADMLVVGRVGWGHGGLREHEHHWTRLTPDEQYTHFSLWALLSSPLLIGCDLDDPDEFTLSLFRNNEVIDVNQDPLGFQAMKSSGDDKYAIYIKPLEDGSLAVGLFNFSEEPRRIGFRPHGFDLIGPQKVRDLWRQQDLGEVGQVELWDTEVAPHGVVLLKLSPGNPGYKLKGHVPYSNRPLKPYWK